MCRRVLCLIAIAGTMCPMRAGAAGRWDNENIDLRAVFAGLPEEVAAKIAGSVERTCGAVKLVQTDVGGPQAEHRSSAAPGIDRTDEPDGVIVFCGEVPDRRHMLTGLPTILVDCTGCGGANHDFRESLALGRQCGTRFITAALSGPADKLESDGQLNELAEKLNVLGALKRLRDSKLITVQDHDGINRIDQGTYYHAPIEDYDCDYPGVLKKHFGIEIAVVRSAEMNRCVAAVPEDKAEEVARAWTHEATEVKNVKHSDILRAARSYLAQRELLREHQADAITLDTATLTFKAYGTATMEQFGDVRAAQPLVIMELSKELIPCCCQSHIDCLVTQMVGTCLTGGSGFTGDFLNDWAFTPTGERPKNVMIVAHCGAPITPYGHDRLPYLIRDHIHNQAFGAEETPTATTVQWPPHEAATLVKFDVYRKQVSVFTGEVLDGNALYEDFANCICRNKIVIRIDDPENCYMLPSNPNAGAFRQCDHWDRKHRHWGGHQVAFYGNLKPAIKDLAALVDFEVVEGR